MRKTRLPEYMLKPANDDHGHSFSYMANYLMIERTALARADVALVFGNRHAYTQLANEAARLYHSGYCRNIIVSGGRTDQKGQIEANTIKELLLQRCVAKKSIIVEDQSSNTSENVVLSRDKAYERFGTFGISSLIAVGSVVAGRRFLMTLARSWPQVFAMASNVNPLPFPVADYGRHEKAASIIRKEFSKIAPYKDAGFINEISLGAINVRAHNLPKPPSPFLG